MLYLKFVFWLMTCTSHHRQMVNFSGLVWVYLVRRYLLGSLMNSVSQVVRTPKAALERLWIETRTQGTEIKAIVTEILNSCLSSGPRCKVKPSFLFCHFWDFEQGFEVRLNIRHMPREESTRILKKQNSVFNWDSLVSSEPKPSDSNYSRDQPRWCRFVFSPALPLSPAHNDPDFIL